MSTKDIRQKDSLLTVQAAKRAILWRLPLDAVWRECGRSKCKSWVGLPGVQGHLQLQFLQEQEGVGTNWCHVSVGEEQRIQKCGTLPGHDFSGSFRGRNIALGLNHVFMAMGLLAGMYSTGGLAHTAIYTV